MPYFAQYDPALDHAHVTAWIDTERFPDVQVPETGVLEVTIEEWNARLSDPSEWAIEGGKLVALVPPPPTLVETAVAALAGSLAITYASEPALSGAYPVSGPIFDDLQKAASFAATFQGFPTGTGSMPIHLPGGQVVTFTDIRHLLAVVKALGMYYAALRAIVVSGAGDLPPSSVTIS